MQIRFQAVKLTSRGELIAGYSKKKKIALNQAAE